MMCADAEPKEKCDSCGMATQARELELWGGRCSICAGMADIETAGEEM